MTILLTKKFETNLGTIQTLIESNRNSPAIKAEALSITSIGHKITLEPFELLNEWLPQGMHFSTSIGWRYFIEKINDEAETLSIYCKLIDSASDTTWGPASGQYLDAISIKNKLDELHIGTEDGEMMEYRAEKEDWIPRRFKNELSIEKSFTEYIPFGFKSIVPALKKDEKLYFHYLVATNPIHQSAVNPSEGDSSTWFAVDQSKEYLDDFLRKIR